MSRDPMEGCWIKVLRAEEHLDSLKSALAAFYEDNKPRITQKINPQRGFKLYRIELPRSAGYPPLAMGVTAGEVAYQLRSALDHLACALVEQNGATVTRDTGFPIFKADNPRRFNKAVEGMADDAIRWVKGLQPYSAPHATDHPLIALHELNLLDKHTVIPVSGSDLRWQIPKLPGVKLRYRDSGVELLMPLHVPFNLNPGPTFGVLFGAKMTDNGFPPEAFGSMNNFVRYELFPLFVSRFFPESPYFREPNPKAQPGYRPS